MQAFKWLYPGMRVKRWLLLAVLGAIVSISGLAVLLGREVVGELELWVMDIARHTGARYVSYWVWGILITALGIAMISLGIRGTIRAIIGVLLPEMDEKLVDVVFQRQQLKRGPRIVAIGGGTGLSTLLRGLKEYTSNITAIVTVTDDGGSSGILRSEMKIPPPGDIRNCLVALADTEPLMEKLFQYRFPKGTGMEGHSFGNLFIATMSDIIGDFEKAVEESSKVLAVRGRVLPSTLSDVVLGAVMKDGTEARGETAIVGSRKGISRVYLIPEDAKPMMEAVKAIEQADAIVLGPGSLYTSILPNLMVKGITNAIKRSKALKIYVCNIMTQPGETDGYTASDHVRAILEHVGRGVVDYALVDTSRVAKGLLEKYRAQGSEPVEPDLSAIASFEVGVVADEFVSEKGFIRHDPAKLARAIMKLLAAKKTGSDRFRLIDFYLSEKLRAYRGRRTGEG